PSFRQGAWRCTPPGRRAGYGVTHRCGSRQRRQWPATRRACCAISPAPRLPRALSAGAGSWLASLRRAGGGGGGSDGVWGRCGGGWAALSGESPVGEDQRGVVVGCGPEAFGGGVVALVLGAFGAQRAEGGGVVAALGRKVAAEAEHVRPGGQPQAFEPGEF